MALGTPGQLADLLGVPFSDEQLEAITAPLAPGVIIAGAGTGKTTVMAARVVWLVGTGQVRPDQVLGLTFTRKAAAELSQRVDASLVRARLAADQTGADAGRQLVMTYDAFAGRLVADHGLRIGVEPDQTMITDATRFRLAMQAVNQFKGPLPGLSHLRPATVADRLLKLDAELRAHLVDAPAVLAHDSDFAKELDEVKLHRGAPTQAVQKAQGAIAARAELLGLVADYRRLKHQRGLVEFADQMAQAAALVTSHGDVARQLRDQFAVVLLDEYQDTSSAQARLLHGLFSGVDAEHGRGHPVTAVGDPFQAIYGWRGAAPSNILQFAYDFRLTDGAAAHRYALRVNRRSRPVILDAANLLAAPLRQDDRLQVRGEGGSQDMALQAPDGKSGGSVQAATFDTWPQEVDWVADQVVAVHEQQLAPQWSRIAVLTRGNAPIGALYQALVERDVPVEIVGLGGLLEVPEIADIVATLTLVDDVTANPEVVRLLSGPRWRIGPRDLAVLADRARELARTADQLSAQVRTGIEAVGADLDSSTRLCLLDAVEDPGTGLLSATARERLHEFAHELRSLAGHRDEPVLELVHRVIESSGVGLELDSDPEWYKAGRSRQLARFIDAVAGYVDIDGDGALSGLLAWLQAERERAEGLDQAVPSSQDSVKLLTAHRAKGLEWDVVFLPGLCEGTFPSTLPPDNWVTQPAVLPAEIRGDREWVPQLGEVTTPKIQKVYPDQLKRAQRQAEDRLVYVATTRARELLVASCHHWFPGRKIVRNRSPYFEVLSQIAAQADGVVCIAEPSGTNPLNSQVLQLPWPPTPDQARAAALRDAAGMVHQARLRPVDSFAGLDAHLQARRWHQLAESLVAEARQRRRHQSEVVLPTSISASGLLLANRDPAGFASQLVRPMPRPVGRQASVGTRFHEWLEKRFAVAALFDPDELEADPPEDDQSAADLMLRRLTSAFERGRYANRTPLCVEEPFILVLAGQQIRGRIDAVFTTPGNPDFDYQVVDWKTSSLPADPLQLSLYRLAWARSVGLPVDRVDAVFHHILSNEVERPAGLLDEPELVELLASLHAADRHGGG